MIGSTVLNESIRLRRLISNTSTRWLSHTEIVHFVHLLVRICRSIPLLHINCSFLLKQFSTASLWNTWLEMTYLLDQLDLLLPTCFPADNIKSRLLTLQSLEHCLIIMQYPLILSSSLVIVHWFVVNFLREPRAEKVLCLLKHLLSLLLLPLLLLPIGGRAGLIEMSVGAGRLVNVVSAPVLHLLLTEISPRLVLAAGR